MVPGVIPACKMCLAFFRLKMNISRIANYYISCHLERAIVVMKLPSYYASASLGLYLKDLSCVENHDYALREEIFAVKATT